MRSDDRVWLDRTLLVLVIGVTGAFATILFAEHLADAELLWRDVYHDRNTHLLRGIDYALALRSLDLAWFLSELEKARVWPPFHGLFLSGVLLVGGIDHRLGVLPSLLGWSVTVVCTWVIARRMFTDRLLGVTAGAVAMTLVMASPALRLLGTDVMLEGLGSGLSALGILLFMRACAQSEDARRWRLLALALGALFLHKMNYWGLAVAALALTAVVDGWSGWRARAWENIGAERARAFLRDAVRHPLLIAGVAVALMAAAIYVGRPAGFSLFGRAVRLYPPGGFTTLAYALLFAWGALQWRRHRVAIDAALGVPGRTLFYWHAVPVAIYFLLPKRLPAFLWFVGPSNNPGSGYNPLNAAAFYWSGFAEGFHVSVWMAALVLVLAAVGAVRAWRLPDGARVVVMFALVSFCAVIVHPQHQSRFLGSWIFSVWIVAGVGAAVVVGWIAAALGGRLRAAWAAAAVAALAAASVSAAPSPAAHHHAIHPTRGTTDLDLVRPYIHELNGARGVMFATTFGHSDLFRWVLHEHCRCKMPVTHPWISHLFSRHEVQALMARRVLETKADHIVLIDAPRSSHRHPSAGWTYDIMVGVVDAMRQQTRFEPIASHPLPGHDAQASIWRRRN